MAHYVIFIEFIKVTWLQKVTSYVNTEHISQKRNFISNVLQPTRSFDHFRFKSYGPLSDFHKSGDLDLAFYPIFKKKIAHSPWSWRHHLSKFQDDRNSGVVCTSRNDRQTDRQTEQDKQTDRGDQHTLRKSEISQSNKQTNRGDQYTLRKSEISQSNKWKGTRSECVLCEILISWDCIIDYNMLRLKVNDKVNLVLMCQMKSVQWVEYYLGYNIATITKKYVTFTFDIWPWLFSLTLIFDLEIDLLLHWCFEEIIAKEINVWCHVTQKWYIVRYIGDDTSDMYFFMEHFATNQKFLRLPVPNI